MSNLTTFAGLDYHQDSVQLCVLDQRGKVRLNRSVPNELQAVVRLLAGQQVGSIALEACCGAAVIWRDAGR